MRQRWRSLNRRLREKWDWSFAHSWIMFTEGQNERSYKDEWEMWKKIEITKQIQTRLNSSFRFFFLLHYQPRSRTIHCPLFINWRGLTTSCLDEILISRSSQEEASKKEATKSRTLEGQLMRSMKCFPMMAPMALTLFALQPHTTQHHTSEREREPS